MKHFRTCLFCHKEGAGNFLRCGCHCCKSMWCGCYFLSHQVWNLRVFGWNLAPVTPLELLSVHACIPFNSIQVWIYWSVYSVLLVETDSFWQAAWNDIFNRNLKEAALLQKNTIQFYSCLHRNTCPGDTKSQRYSHHVHCARQLCPWPLTGTVTQGAAHSLSSLSSCTVPRMPGKLLFSHSAAFVSGQVWSTQKEVIM